MNIFESILLGIIQGLTEFIPVSSSGHLVLLQHFLGWGESENILFEVFLHLGTLFAVLLYFHKTIWELIKSLFSWKNTVNREIHRKNRNLIVYLIISTLFTGVYYYFFGDAFRSIYQMPMFVALLLLVTGIIIFVSDFFRDGDLPASNMGFLRAITIGLCQGMAILPGISRSGTTISSSLAMGIKRKDAAHYSFLLSIPAIIAANISEFKALVNFEIGQMQSYLAGFISSFVVGYLIIAFLIRMIEGNRLKYFAYYCWIVGLISIVLLSLGL